MRVAGTLVGLLLLLTDGLAGRQTETIDAIIRAQMDAQQIPGLAVAVIRRGEIIKALGYGLANVEHKVPVTDQTMFQSGLDRQAVHRDRHHAAGGRWRARAGGPIASSSSPTDRRRGSRSRFTICSRTRRAFPITRRPARLPARLYRGRTGEVRANAARSNFTPGREWRYSNTGVHPARRDRAEGVREVLRRCAARAGLRAARHDRPPASSAKPTSFRTALRAISWLKGVLQNQDWVAPSLNTTADGSFYLSLRDYIAWDRGLAGAGDSEAGELGRDFRAGIASTAGARHRYGFGWDVERVAGQQVTRHGGAGRDSRPSIARYLGDDVTIDRAGQSGAGQTERIVNEIAAHYIPELKRPSTWVITGAQVIDGSGGALRRADVRVRRRHHRRGGAITSRSRRIASWTPPAWRWRRASSMCTTTRPTASTSDPEAITQVSQGITTLLIGQDGDSPFPIGGISGATARGARDSMNVAMLVGHADDPAPGDGRRLSAGGHRRGESRRWKRWSNQEMHDGAIGLSSGLEYEVGSYAATEEVVALARVAAKHGGFYISHIRDEADTTLEAVREAIPIGERARLPVQITHIKLGTIGVWGKAAEVVAMIDAAAQARHRRDRGRLSVSGVVLEPQGAGPQQAVDRSDERQGGTGRCRRRQEHPAYPSAAVPAACRQAPDEIAKAEGLSEVEMYIRLVQDDDVSVIGHTMPETTCERSCASRGRWSPVTAASGRVTPGALARSLACSAASCASRTG